MSLFAFKKIIGPLLMPFPLLMLFAFAGVLIAARYRRAGLTLSSLSLITLYLISTPWGPI